MMNGFFKCDRCGHKCWEDELGSKREYHSEVDCSEYLACCPECGSEDITEISRPAMYMCLDCEKEFYETEMPAYRDEYTCPFCGSANVEEET